MSGSLGKRKPLDIGKRLRIALPDAAAEPADDGVNLVIPWGAFGSGEHETTASCLEEIERLAPFDGMSVLDVGCGTGILAIAALRLGAARAVGVDVSARAAVTTRETARLNQVEDRLVVVLGPLDSIAPAHFDLIVANLHGDLLLDLAASIVATAAPAVPLVLSGIAWDYAYAVREEFVKLGCGVVSERWLEEFVTLTLTARRR